MVRCYSCCQTIPVIQSKEFLYSTVLQICSITGLNGRRQYQHLHSFTQMVRTTLGYQHSNIYIFDGLPTVSIYQIPSWSVNTGLIVEETQGATPNPKSYGCIAVPMYI